MPFDTEPSSRAGIAFFSSAPTRAFRPLNSHDGWHNDGDLGFGRPIRRSGWRRSADTDRESLRELALRKSQGPFGVPTDLAVRGAASLALLACNHELLRTCSRSTRVSRDRTNKGILPRP
jgi:hypothetical protein